MLYIEQRLGPALLLVAADEEGYCLKTQAHAPAVVGSNLICYRCGFLMGSATKEELGSPLDF